MHAFVVLGFVFPHRAKRLAWGSSPKWHILCRVGRNTLTESINQGRCTSYTRVSSVAPFTSHFYANSCDHVDFRIGSVVIRNSSLFVYEMLKCHCQSYKTTSTLLTWMSERDVNEWYSVSAASLCCVVWWQRNNELSTEWKNSLTNYCSSRRTRFVADLSQTFCPPLQ